MSLVLRGVDYGPVQSASGAQGWFGEGYWYHKWVPGLRWNGCTFVSKTTTLRARAGNMPLNAEGKAKELLPKCVIVKMRKGIVLNSVGLSGPGAEVLLQRGEWQKRTRPFFLSFMSVAATIRERVHEAEVFAQILRDYAKGFSAPFGLQVNLSCPNTGHDTSMIADESREILNVFQGLRNDLNIPVVPKFNVLYPVESIGDLVDQDLFDGICVSNTLPWGTLPAAVDWYSLFPNKAGEKPVELDPTYNPISGRFAVNPLSRIGIKGGGLSGAPLLPLVAEWVESARGRGVKIPINAGGGILGPKDVNVLAEAGANSVFLGSIAILRGWRLRRTISYACRVFR